MKVFFPSVLIGLTTLAALTSADKSFNASSKTGAKIKTAVSFGNKGGQMTVCPSGDCAVGQQIRVTMARLEEYDASGKAVNNKAETFASADFGWTELDDDDINDAAVLATSYSATLDVGPNGKAGAVDLNVTAAIFLESGYADNGNMTVPVKAGNLKFSVAMANWPFQNASNHVRFGITLASKGKDGKDRVTASKAARNGTKDLERVDLSEGMFLDAPTIAVVDGVDRAIVSTLDVKNGKMELIWEFPAFEDSLYYDPVIGSDDYSAQPRVDSSSGSTGTGGSGSTGTGTGSGSDGSTTGSGSSGKPTTKPTTPAVTTKAPTPAATTKAPDATSAPTPTPKSAAATVSLTTTAAVLVSAIAGYFTS